MENLLKLRPLVSNPNDNGNLLTGVVPGEGSGAIAPPSEHASPPMEGETQFFQRFLAFIVL